MNGTITLDMTQDGNVICNATRNEPYANSRQILSASRFGDILAFVSEYIECINDDTRPWKKP